ncbi:MAG: SLC13 family permease [Candidatus Calescibacterium sp.]|nr:SLC13 family permease [Candidatus Calescibacterium sp.]MCX7734900.1 SLC13 family permease [bacterium]
MKRISLIVLPLVSVLISYIGGFDFRQIIAIGILVLFITSTLLYWQFRSAFALMGVSLLFMLGLLDIRNFINFAQLDVVIFLVGMMTVIGVLEERHFFDYILDIIGQKIRSGTVLYVIILVMSAVMAALVDEVTSIIFITFFILKVSKALDVNPVPLVLASIFATNVGSSATVVGNPIGVIVALRGGFSFTDFLIWSAPNALLILFITIVLCSVIWASYIREINSKLKKTGLRFDIQKDISTMQFTNVVIFLGTIVMLVLHSPIENVMEKFLGKEKGDMKNVFLVAVPLFWASVGLLLERHRAREIILYRVDWVTLLFFTLLFSTVGTLKYTGAGVKIGEYIISVGTNLGKIIGSAESGTLFSVFAFQGILTAFLDNVLAIAVLVPVVFSIYESQRCFCFLLGATFFRNYGWQLYTYWFNCKYNRARDIGKK